MTGNNVTYTYGTSGTSRWRPIHISDGTGSHELTYDALGNVTAETRTIVLPNSHEEFSLTMNYEYDSWGRMLSITYPDGEEVSYTYQWGGDLSAMQSVMGVNTRTYIGQIQYNDYGQKSHVTYGNSASAEYSYDALHRLANLKSRNGGGTLMQNIDYTYDNASNVTGIVNTAGVVNSLGGGYGNTYQYDALHRLVGSTGGGASTGTYNMTMHYSGSGRIRAKYRSSLSPTLSGTVNTYYGYCDEYQPHAVRRIYDEYNQKHYDFRWDASGNLGQVSYGNEEALFESGRFMYWTEDNRMHVAVDDKHYSYYAYDYSGERRIKLTGDNSVLDVNADYMRTISTLENVTLYPSAYMVLTDRGYTKHYYTGMERVAARIGDGGLDVGFYLSNTDSLHARANRLFSQSLAQVNRRVLEANDVDCIMDGEMPVEELGIPFEEIPEQMSATVGTEYGEFVGAMHLVSNAGESPEVYYYHGDHLGSASWITDASGAAVQHLQYLPFGERFVDQRTSGYCERFTFTGKERDKETGFGYFGARYMDHELMTMWLSVDPMADKYPSISPYAYCAWNPVKLVDPDGCMIDEWRIDLNTGEVTKVGNKGGKTTDYYSFGTTNTQGDWLPDATRDDVEISRNQSGGTINSFRVNESNNSTLSIFHIPDDDISGFFLERGGPDTKAPKQNKRILEGEYNFVKHSSSDKFFNNRAKLTSKNDSKFVNRAILIHPGNNYWDSKGCLLPGTTASKNNNGDYSVGASKNKTAVLENYIRRNNWNVTLTITNRF